MASSPARAVGEQAPVALPADLPAHLADALVADLADRDPVVTSSLDAAVAGWAGRQLAVQRAAAAGACRTDLVAVNTDRRVIAIDGKTLRGSAPRATPEQAAAAAQGGGRTHLVAGYDQASGVTLGQGARPPAARPGGEG